MSGKKSIKILVEDADNEPLFKKKATTEKAKEDKKTVALKSEKLSSKSKPAKGVKESKKNVVDLGSREAASAKLFSVIDSDAKKSANAAISKPKAGSSKISVRKEKDEDLEISDESRITAKTAKEVDIDELLFEKSDAVKKVIDEESRPGKGGKEKTEPRAADKPDSRPKLKLYRRIVYFFMFLTFALIATVSYFLFVKVDIVLIPNQERISNNMIFEVDDKDSSTQAGTNSVKGIVKKTNVDQVEEFPSSGEEIIGQEAIGKITIVNNYIKNQPLVASTRILAVDGKLFRLKNTVNAPAGSSVDAEIYADEPSPEMAISPTKFTIPGLWAGLQDKIYAESKEPVVFQKKVKKHIAPDDIENAIRDLKLKILTTTKEQVNEEYKDYGQILYKIDDNSIKSEVANKTGDEVDTFKVTVSAEVVIVAFNSDQATAISKQKFISSLPEGKEMISFDEDKIIYALENYDITNGSAMVDANFEGKISLKSDNDLSETSNALGLDKEKLLGLNEGQLNAYLKSLPDIAGFEIKFFPSFIKRVPNVNARVNIEIKK